MQGSNYHFACKVNINFYETEVYKNAKNAKQNSRNFTK